MCPFKLMYMLKKLLYNIHRNPYLESTLIIENSSCKLFTHTHRGGGEEKEEGDDSASALEAD